MMNKIPPFLSRLSAIALILTVVSSAREIQFKTLCLAQVNGVTKVRLATDKEGGVSPEISLFKNLSPTITEDLKGDEAVFYSEVPGEDGKPQRTVAGKARLAGSSRQFFLFIPGPGEDAETPYKVFAYDDSPDSFPMGHVRAINTSTVPIRFQTPDGFSDPVPPGEMIHFPHSAKVDEYNVYQVTTQFNPEGDNWINGQATKWKADSKRRDTVVIIEDPKTKVRSVSFFSELPDPVIQPSRKKKKKA